MSSSFQPPHDYLRREIEATAGLQCIGCGCTEYDACIDEETGEPCYWAGRTEDGPVCSVCARVALAVGAIEDEPESTDPPADQPLVELYSECGADRFLRARRAGA